MAKAKGTRQIIMPFGRPLPCATALCRSGGLMLSGFVLLPGGAMAAGKIGAILPFLSGEVFMTIACAVTAGQLIWAFIAGRKLSREELAARRRVHDLEIELTETEAALTAEPHILLVWRGRGTDPDKIVGDMRGTARVPADHQQLMDFSSWLELESANALGEALSLMR